MIDGEISKNFLIKNLYNSILSEELAAFIGAGFSIPAGFTSWKELLREPAIEIGLNVDKEYDLVSLAQYYCNAKNRTGIDDLITRNFVALTNPTRNHMLLAQLPINTYWTTNYDRLIEQSLEENRKLPNVKTKDEQLRGTNKSFDAVVYKMHGDASYPSEAVFTRTDYENYGYVERKLFREVLEGDLLTKTFLFLGFSFTDPNFNYVIARLRVLLDEHGTRQHYCVMKRESDNDEYAKIKQELQIQDLKRYGIHTCLIDDYSEITEILQTLVNKFRRRTIFISGSAFDYANLRDDIGKRLVSELAYQLVSKGYHIVNGYGLGIGTFVINGVARYCYSSKTKNINDFLTLMPFPLEANDDDSLHRFYSDYRHMMIEKCGIAIYLFGNKQDKTVANGVIEEYEIADKLGLVSLPVNCTGGAASKIYNLEIEKLKPDDNDDILKLVGNDFSDISNLVGDIIKAVNILNEEES